MAINMQTSTTRNRLCYHLVRNALASKLANKDVFTACTTVSAPANLHEVAQRMAEGRCPYAVQDISHILDLFVEKAQELLQSGTSINVGGLMLLRPSIRGTFNALSDAFTADKNRVVVNATAGTLIRNAATSATLMKTGAQMYPTFANILNGATGQPYTITANATASVTGAYLLFDEAAEDEGYFLVSNGVETKVTLVGPAFETSAILQMPESLIKGQSYQLIFKSREGDTSLLSPFTTAADVTVTTLEA